MSRKARTETPESMHSMTVQYALNHRYLQPQRNYHQQHTSRSEHISHLRSLLLVINAFLFLYT